MLEIPFLKSSGEGLTIRAKKSPSKGDSKHNSFQAQNKIPVYAKKKKPLLIQKAELETYAITYALK